MVFQFKEDEKSTTLEICIYVFLKMFTLLLEQMVTAGKLMFSMG